MNNENLNIQPIQEEDIESQVNRQILKLQEYRQDVSEQPYVHPRIQLRKGLLHQAVDQAEQILIEGNHGIFQRCGMLVRLIPIASKPVREEGVIKPSYESIMISEVDSTYLTEVLGIAGNWTRYDKTREGNIPIDCPETIGKKLIARKKWGLPVLIGVIHAPTLCRDGTILQEPGYDEESGLFFYPSNTKFEEIPVYPTEKDVKTSLDLLLDLLSEFPFIDSVSRSVALSAILTSLVRKSIRTAPLHGFSAPKKGSGKSLLADVVGLIATGNPVSMVSYTGEEAEEEKRVLTLLLEGCPIICYDNVDRSFLSSVLCTILTQTAFKGRILGLNKSAYVSTYATFLATGNNLIFEGDISRRVMLCKIDPRKERPEERSFKKDLYDFIPKNRSRLVKAGLTILRAYHLAGRPKQLFETFGSFEEWSDWIRSALVWLGMADPCLSRIEVEQLDPIKTSLEWLFSVWFSIFGNRPIKVKNLVHNESEQLKEVLQEFAPDGHGGINEIALGKKLLSFNQRIEAGFQLQRMGKNQGAVTWRIDVIKQES